MKKAVIVLSGGLDSTTCMGIAKEQGYELYPITFHYGQRHNREVEQAKIVSQYYEVKDHRIVDISFLQDIGGSALTDRNIDVPKGGGEDGTIPSTYVPARNLIFLSLSTAYAEVVGAEVIYIGVSAVDYSGYPDCRPEFIESMSSTIQLATKAGTSGSSIRIETPLIHLSKAETIQKGMELGVPYALTTSCYHGDETACGECDSCRLRIKGFKEAGYHDPVSYGITLNWGPDLSTT
jgi:7-cyano-7-deazaguanine synthase